MNFPDYILGQLLPIHLIKLAGTCKHLLTSCYNYLRQWLPGLDWDHYLQQTRATALTLPYTHPVGSAYYPLLDHSELLFRRAWQGLPTLGFDTAETYLGRILGRHVQEQLPTPRCFPCSYTVPIWCSPEHTPTIPDTRYVNNHDHVSAPSPIPDIFQYIGDHGCVPAARYLLQLPVAEYKTIPGLEDMVRKKSRRVPKKINIFDLCVGFLEGIQRTMVTAFHSCPQLVVLLSESSFWLSLTGVPNMPFGRRFPQPSNYHDSNYESIYESILETAPLGDFHEENGFWSRLLYDGDRKIVFQYFLDQLHTVDANSLYRVAIRLLTTPSNNSQQSLGRYDGQSLGQPWIAPTCFQQSLRRPIEQHQVIPTSPVPASFQQHPEQPVLSPVNQSKCSLTATTGKIPDQMSLSRTFLHRATEMGFCLAMDERVPADQYIQILVLYGNPISYYSLAKLLGLATRQHRLDIIQLLTDYYPFYNRMLVYSLHEMGREIDRLPHNSYDDSLAGTYCPTTGTIYSQRQEYERSSKFVRSLLHQYYIRGWLMNYPVARTVLTLESLQDYGLQNVLHLSYRQCHRYIAFWSCSEHEHLPVNQFQLLTQVLDPDNINPIYYYIMLRHMLQEVPINARKLRVLLSIPHSYQEDLFEQIKDKVHTATLEQYLSGS